MTYNTNDDKYIAKHMVEQMVNRIKQGDADAVDDILNENIEPADNTARMDSKLLNRKLQSMHDNNENMDSLSDSVNGAYDSTMGRLRRDWKLPDMINGVFNHQSAETDDLTRFDNANNESTASNADSVEETDDVEIIDIETDGE